MRLTLWFLAAVLLLSACSALMAYQPRRSICLSTGAYLLSVAPTRVSTTTNRKDHP